MNIPAEIKELLLSPKKIVISTHSNPDGDAIGSSLAMYAFLIKKGHTASVIIPNDYPEFLDWLPANESITVYDHEPEVCHELLKEADIIFCLDYSAIHRVWKLSEPIRKAGAIKILIDHHPDPEGDDFDYLFSEEKTSSTGELIFDFINGLGDRDMIDKPIAECIYVGIMTDTGSFSYACNGEHTYLVVAELFRLGIDGEHIHRLVYDKFSESRLRLLGYCLSEKLVVLMEFATAYIYLSRKDLERFNFKIGDTEGVVNYALSIKGIRFAALFMEREKKIRISFRSKGDFSVNEFARKHYAGGGHKNAAGGDSFLSFDKTIQHFRELLTEYKDQLLFRNC